MADRGGAGQLGDHAFLAEVVADMTGGAMTEKLAILVSDDSCGFLPTMLQRVKPRAVSAAESMWPYTPKIPHSSCSLSSSNGLVVRTPAKFPH